MDAAYKEFLVTVLNDLIAPLAKDREYEIDVCKEADQWRVNVNGDLRDLVGENAEVLRSVQHILRKRMHIKFPKDRTHFVLDIGMYRSSREAVMKERVKLIAERQVLLDGLTLILVGLSSYERRIIHGLLVDIDGLETTSVGQGDNRKLLIRPTSEIGAKGMDAARVIDLFSDKSELK